MNTPTTDIEKEIEEITKGRIYCNCDCGGPFCDTLVHFCHKPDEHYSQRDQMYINFLKESGEQIKQSLIQEIKSKLPKKEALTGDIMNPKEILQGGFNQAIDEVVTVLEEMK